MPVMLGSVSGFDSQKGSTLIETLIALFILAIGLLGVLAMQTVSVNSNQRAQFSSEVALLASDIADSILAYVEPGDPTDDDDFDGIDTANPVAQLDCAVGCDAAAQVNFSVFNWRQAIQSDLPSGRGIINYNGASNLYTVQILWDNERTGALGTGCSGDPDVDLACYTIQVPVL